MFMSEEMLQLLGYKLEEVVGKDYLDTFVPEDQRERLNEIFDMLGKSRTQVFDENILIAKDGRELLVKWQWWSVFSKKSEFDFYFGVGSDITGFIRSEETAQENDTPFPMLAENAMDIVWTVDIDLRFTYISHSITELLGYSVKEILGYPLEKILTPASLKVVKKTLSEELIFEFNDKKGSYKTRSLELELRHRDGFTLLTENKMKFLHDVNGRPAGILIITRDINERRRKEEELRDKIIQTLFDGAPNPIFVADEAGRYVDANRAGLAFLECDKESLQVKDVKDFTPTFLKDANCVEDFSLLLKGRTFESDFCVNGVTKTLLLSVVPFHLSGRSILFWIGQDITSRKQAEGALRESEEKYRLLIEYQTDLVVKMDAKGRFLFVSPSYCKLFGKKEKDLIGESFLNLVCKEDRTETAKAMKRLQTPPHTCFIEHRVFIRDKQRYIAWQLKGIKGERGNVDTIVGGGRDISKRKKAEEEKENIQAQLLQAQKMEAIGTLAGGIAHDFNNLITVIKGHSELLMRKIAPEEGSLREHVEEVGKAASSAAMLTSQLLTFSRRHMCQPILMDINSLIEDLEKMTRRLIGEDIRLKTVIGEDAGFVRADPTQITQIIMNLAVNARDSMPEGGDLMIRTEALTLKGKQQKIDSGRRNNQFVCLSVQDTGTGIDAETLPHIFEPFFTTKRPGEGTGLGLSVVYGIIKQHGGWIEVESEVGKGTVFKVYLPRIPLKKGPKARNGTTIVKGRGERILLIEDERAVRRYINEALQENGYEIIDAATAKEAIDIFEREGGNFDLILSDVVLPEINGINLVEQFLHLKPALKVLLTSGYMDRKSQWPVIKERGYTFLQKPFDQADLFKAVRKALS